MKSIPLFGLFGMPTLLVPDASGALHDSSALDLYLERVFGNSSVRELELAQQILPDKNMQKC